MSRISVRGIAVASATAVTTIGAVAGVASGSTTENPAADFEATAAEATLLAEIPAGQHAQVQTTSLAQQADAQAYQADTAAQTSAQEAARTKAAETAKAKKAAADSKAAAEKKAAEERAEAEKASRSAERSSDAGSGDSGGGADASSFTQQSSYSTAQVQAMARQMIPGDQFQCFSNIVDHESGWNYKAVNPSSGAYGLMQALPGTKMASAGADWQTNPATQIKWGLSYMDSRYGSPCGAWEFWQANNWY